MAGYKINKISSYDNQHNRVVVVEHADVIANSKPQSMYLHVDKVWTEDDVVNALVKRGYIKRLPDGTMTLEGISRYARDFIEEAFTHTWWEVEKPWSWDHFLAVCADGYGACCDEATMELFKSVPRWRWAVAYAKTMQRVAELAEDDASHNFPFAQAEIKIDLGSIWKTEIVAIIGEYRCVNPICECGGTCQANRER
jgi:hypothetical protein